MSGSRQESASDWSRSVGLHRLDQLRPRGHEAQVTWHRGGERGAAIAQVLDERMPAGEASAEARLFEAAHRIQPLLQVAVVALQRRC